MPYVQHVTFKSLFFKTTVFTIPLLNVCTLVLNNATALRERLFEREFYALQRGMQNSEFVFLTK